MKHKALTVFAILLVLAGLTMLIVPRISNRIGEQIAHSTIGDFKAVKSKATTDEPIEKKESDEDGLRLWIAMIHKEIIALLYRVIINLSF